MSEEFKNFLNERKTKENEKSTHNSLQYPFVSVKINNEDLPSFYKLYEDNLLNNANLGMVKQHNVLDPY